MRKNIILLSALLGSMYIKYRIYKNTVRLMEDVAARKPAN